MSAKHLTSEEMAQVGVVFIESLIHVLNNTDDDTRRKHLEFVLNVALKEMPYMLVTPQGVSRMVNEVWSQQERRDLLLALSFVFFSRLGGSDDFVSGLSGNLARGCSIVDAQVRDDYSAVPEDVGNRLADIESASKIINANRWLMMVLLIQAFFDRTMLDDTVKAKRN